ncbi:hypothetical protein QJS04_geneDACA023813 [Acorus gramineus]|uniref:CUE domain-containing protein n=1 Tax=Acorus gramineus TaxID=55184 RepID=A0AAV9AKG7_ACOGR|nr:hypothetical protein QJS04_geneDACA023813 [Acorus gramineus]
MKQDTSSSDKFPITSSLNPNAAPFIPMSQRALRGDHENHSSDFTSDSFMNLQISESSRAVTDAAMQQTDAATQQTVANDFMLAIDHLCTVFPNYDVESIVDLYYANEGDFELTVEMLESFESMLKQPDIDQNLNSNSTVGGDGSSTPNTEEIIVSGLSSSSDSSSLITGGDTSREKAKTSD